MSEYLPLSEHLKGEGLQDGTVLECIFPTGGAFQSTWNGTTFLDIEWNPFVYTWRIVSTPPKKITFEDSVWAPRDGSSEYVYLPRDSGFSVGDAVIVTVEEKR